MSTVSFRSAACKSTTRRRRWLSPVSDNPQRPINPLVACAIGMAQPAAATAGIRPGRYRISECVQFDGYISVKADGSMTVDLVADHVPSLDDPEGR